MGEGAQGHQLGQSAAQRESMDAAAAEVSKSTIAAQQHQTMDAVAQDSTKSTLDAAATQKRWRAFASRVAAARRPRSVAAQRILQGLAPVGRVVVRARSTAQRVDIVRAALGASDAWARGTGDRGASSVWAAHGAADDAVQLCAHASKRNAKRAVEARDALASQSADAAPGSDAITRARVAWPPPTVAAGKGAFAEVRWMEEPAKQAVVPSQEVAWSRVLRELGVDPAAAKAALAVEHYEEAAGVEKRAEPEPEARPEKRFALGLSTWAESVTSQLKDKDGSTFEAVVAKAFDDAKAGAKKTEYSGLRLPTEMIDDFTTEYVLSFSSVSLQPNVAPESNKATLDGKLLHCRLQQKNAGALLLDAGKRLVGGGQRLKLTAVLDEDYDKRFDKDALLSIGRSDKPTIASNVVHSA